MLIYDLTKIMSLSKLKQNLEWKKQKQKQGTKLTAQLRLNKFNNF